MTCYDLAILYETAERQAEANVLFAEALEIAERYPDNPTCAQIIRELRI